RGPIPTSGADFPPNADNVGLVRLQIARYVAVVLLPGGGRHEHTDVLPYHLVGGIPKEALGSRVERLDDAPLVNGDDPVHRGLQNGVRASLSRSTAAACSWTTMSSSCCWCSVPSATCNACSEPCKASILASSLPCP